MKNQFQDIRPTHSLKNSGLSPISSPTVNKVPSGNKVEIPINNKDVDGGGSSYIKNIIIVVLFVAIVGFVLSIVFRGASVRITPKSVTGTVDVTVLAKKGAQTGVSFELASLSDTEKKYITSTTTEMVSAKSKGTIIVYNKLSTTEKFVAGTRFQSTDGKIFKTESPITIPKQTTQNGKVIPGKVEVDVVASVAGPEYNIAPSDFTVPGLKGSPKYASVYARSKGAFSGGSQGVMFTVTKDTLDQTQKELTKALEKRLRDELNKQIPKGYILPPTSISFEEQKNTTNVPVSEKSDIEIVVSGVERAMLIDQKSIEREIKNTLVHDVSKDTKLEVTGLENFTYVITGLDQVYLGKTDEVSVHVSGEATVTWKPDEQTIISKLTGAKRRDFNTIMQTIEGVTSAELILKPFWNLSLPKDESRITVIDSRVD